MRLLSSNSCIRKQAYLLIFIPLFLTSCTYTFYSGLSSYPTTGALKKVAVLSDSINETSGLLIDGESHITFNDSGGEAALYSYDEVSSLDKTMITKAVNVDWEAIAGDETHIYVADVGNNFGTRDTLLIYKIPRENLKDHTLNELEKITFTYDEEVSFNESGWYSHDCESLFAYGDSLYLHAKDWVKKETRIYVLPKEAGHYKIQSRRSYQVKALVTGSDIFPEKNEVVLVGYRNYMPVIIKYHYKTDPGVIQQGGKARIYPLKVGTQTEGVAYDAEGNIYVTSEKMINKQALYRAY